MGINNGVAVGGTKGRRVNVGTTDGVNVGGRGVKVVVATGVGAIVDDGAKPGMNVAVAAILPGRVTSGTICDEVGAAREVAVGVGPNRPNATTPVPTTTINPSASATPQ